MHRIRTGGESVTGKNEPDGPRLTLSSTRPGPGSAGNGPRRQLSPRPLPSRTAARCGSGTATPKVSSKRNWRPWSGATRPRFNVIDTRVENDIAFRGYVLCGPFACRSPGQSQLVLKWASDSSDRGGAPTTADNLCAGMPDRRPRPSVFVDREQAEPLRGAGRLLCALVVIVTGFAVLLLVPARSAAETPFGPHYRSCGSFHAEYKINVYASRVNCRRAMRIQREFWLAPPDRIVEVYRRRGPQLILLKRFPGWKCFSGAGGGGCHKGRKVAAYTDA